MANVTLELEVYVPVLRGAAYAPPAATADAYTVPVLRAVAARRGPSGEAVPGGALQLEDGTYLLAEDGDYLEVE